MHYPLSAYQYNAMHKYGYGGKPPTSPPQPIPPQQPPEPKYPPITPDSPWPPKPISKYGARSRGGQLSRYRAFGSLEEAVDDIGQKAESLMVQAKQQVEEAGSAVVHTMEDATTRQRQRQAVYMVAAPLIIFSGLTNKRYKTVGMMSALAGALIGFRHYTEYKNVQALRNQVGLK